MSATAQVRTALRTALHGVKGSPVTSGIAAGTIGLCLLLVGAFALLVSNMECLLDRFGEGIVSEKPLDEVILNYLVDNARSKRRRGPGT